MSAVSAGRPTRATLAGKRFLELRAKAKRERRPTDELLQLYALEGFLERLANSPHASRWVLKGGVLLAAYNVRRPTRDIDLQGRRISGAASAVLARLSSCRPPRLQNTSVAGGAGRPDLRCRCGDGGDHP